MRALLLAAGIVIATPFVASAQTPSTCAAIADDAQRLACYDQASPRKSSIAPAAPAPQQLNERRGWRAALERVFLSSGVAADVFLGGPGETKLTVWTRLNKADVYKLVTEGKMLERARDLGVREVDFWDKGHEGHWVFRLSPNAALPRCDQMKRLCL